VQQDREDDAERQQRVDLERRLTTGESLQPPSASGGSCAACGWISGLPR
jgi:hypothetical protein